jgi:hypothetical protein
MSNYQDKHKEIIINSFEESYPFLKDIDASTLVVFDVDSVLIIPKKLELHPFIFQKYADLVKRLYEPLSREQRHFLNHNIAAHSSILVDPLCDTFIKELQQENTPTIALTAAKKGRFNREVVDFHHIRFQQLSSLGIDFSKNLFIDSDFTNLTDTFGDYPGIRKGIIYASGFNNKKGDVLNAFLKDKKIFERIILFDDKLKHLQSVSQSLKLNFPKMELLAFHYQGIKNLKLSKEVGQNQFEEYLEKLIRKVDDLDWVNS